MTAELKYDEISDRKGEICGNVTTDRGRTEENDNANMRYGRRK